MFFTALGTWVHNKCIILELKFQENQNNSFSFIDSISKLSGQASYLQKNVQDEHSGLNMFIVA